MRNGFILLNNKKIAFLFIIIHKSYLIFLNYYSNEKISFISIFILKKKKKKNKELLKIYSYIHLMKHFIYIEKKKNNKLFILFF